MLCEVELGNYGDADSYEQCRAPTDQIVTAGCVHEHLKTQPTCLSCIANIDTVMWCDYCEFGDTPHRCAIRLVARETIVR